MQAMFTFSLGDLLSASVRPPATQKPTPAKLVCLRKSRRLVLRFMIQLPKRGWRGMRNYRMLARGLSVVCADSRRRIRQTAVGIPAEIIFRREEPVRNFLAVGG